MKIYGNKMTSDTVNAFVSELIERKGLDPETCGKTVDTLLKEELDTAVSALKERVDALNGLPVDAGVEKTAICKDAVDRANDYAQKVCKLFNANRLFDRLYSLTVMETDSDMWSAYFLDMNARGRSVSVNLDPKTDKLVASCKDRDIEIKPYWLIQNRYETTLGGLRNIAHIVGHNALVFKHMDDGADCESLPLEASYKDIQSRMPELEFDPEKKHGAGKLGEQMRRLMNMCLGHRFTDDYDTFAPRFKNADVTYFVNEVQKNARNRDGDLGYQNAEIPSILNALVYQSIQRRAGIAYFQKEAAETSKTAEPETKTAE